MKRLLFLIIIFAAASMAHAQSWSGILDPTRATVWQGNVGFTIPNYTVNCSTQPSLTAGSGNAAANTTAIQNSAASCDATHNVVLLPAGTYSFAGLSITGHSKFVIRGAGPMSTTLLPTAGGTCQVTSGNPYICFQASASQFAGPGNANVVPGGDHACSSWNGASLTSTVTSGTYVQGASFISVNTCGFTPTVGQIVDLDQADDGNTDTGGVWICHTATCNTNGTANNDGRVISSVQYSEQQQTLITRVVSGSGSGPYVLQISPALYFNNIRTSQTPGLWLPASTPITLVGIENLTIDYTGLSSNNYGIAMTTCYQCWIRNVRSNLGANVDHTILISDLEPVVRDSYFYGSNHQGSESYAVQMLEVSGGLVENNIMQNTTSPDIKDAVTGSVSAYNFTPFINFGQNASVGAAFVLTSVANHSGSSTTYTGTFSTGAGNALAGETFVIHGFGNNANNGVFPATASSTTTLTVTNGAGVAETHTGSAYFGTFMQGMYASHNSGSGFNLGEGNSTPQFLADDVWGTSDVITVFRNQAQCWQPGYTGNPQTNCILFSAGTRGMNVIGNVLGQPGFHTQYQVYATGTSSQLFTLTQGGSTSSGSGPNPFQTIYGIGNTDTGSVLNCATPVCDALGFTTMFRWGNYDVINGSVFASSESAPGAVFGLAAQSTPASHTLPASFYLASRPSWFRSVPFPPYGPDVSGGNTGQCVGGAYAGSEASSSGQCTGGTFSASQWAGHANINPAQDCYLNVMNGPPDGTGPVLAFDANTCYTSSATPPPPGIAPFFTLILKGTEIGKGVTIP